MKAWVVGSIVSLGLFIGTIGSVYAGGFIAIEGSAISYGDSVGNDESEGGMRLRIGKSINPVMDLEGHLGFSLKGRNTEESDSGSPLYYGMFLKAYLPLGGGAALYGLGGLASVNLDQSSGLLDSRAGFAYGLGLEWRLAKGVDMTADFMSYLRDSEDTDTGLLNELTSLSLGIKLYF